MKQIPVRLQEEILVKMADLQEKLSISRSDLIRDALKHYLEDKNSQYEQIPSEIRDRLEFMSLIAISGSEKDWDLICQEVIELWKSMQS